MVESSMINGRFTGDPSYLFEQKVPPKFKDIEEFEGTIEAIEPHLTMVTLKEEDRLAAIVSLIDQDACIVPRGAYIKDPTGRVKRNRAFEGLTSLEASQLQYYFHFRRTVTLDHKTMRQVANHDRSIDFLDSIEDDIPNVSWSLQIERGGGLVLVRNLQWLGYTFYHIPGTKEYGSAYFGTGEKNIDVPFML